ncbi:hypothetical protein ABBQ32_002914 [Trebouxia sp. C0010 RCD-2024]
MAETSGFVIVIASVFAAFLGWAFWRRVRRSLQYDLRRIPGPQQLPVLGNLTSVIGSSYAHRVLAQWTFQYGPIFKWNLAGKTILVVTDPVEVYKLCGREAQLDRARFMYKLLNAREPYNSLLATPDYQEWKYFRKTLNPAFSPDNIRKAYPKIYAAAVKGADLLCKMSSNGAASVDMSNLAGRITAEVILGAFFDVELSALDYSIEKDGSVKLSEQPYLKNLKKLQDTITMAFTNPIRAVMLQLLPWLPEAKQNKACLTSIQQYEDHLAEVIRDRGRQPESNTDLWACLGRLVNYKDDSPLPMPTLAANAGLFFAGGYETTSHAISWALFELAADPSLQDKVHQELAAAGLAPTPGHRPLRHLEFSDLSKLKMLDAVGRETLRLHSTAPLGTVRETGEDMVILGYRIPKGTALMFPPHAAHLSPYNFSHPSKFWPDRWTSGVLGDWDPKRSAYPDATPAGNQHDTAASWNPFSTGPRNCIGQALALAELRTVLAVLLANFFFELPDGVQREKFIEEEEVWWVSLQAKNGMHLRVTPVVEVEEKKKPGFVPKSDFYSQELLRLVKEAEEDGAPGKQ